MDPVPDEEAERGAAAPMFCGGCGTSSAFSDDRFCRSCGAGLSRPQSTSPVQVPRVTPEPANASARLEPSSPAPSGQDRNAGNVLWGVVWGLFVHIAIFFMLFNMKKGPKREDRVFGYWLGLSGSVVVAVTIGAILAVTSSQTSSATGRAAVAQHQPTSVQNVPATRSTPPRTAPEIINAVRSVRPEFCTPSGHSTDERTGNQVWNMLVGPSRLSDGDWLLSCQTVLTWPPLPGLDKGYKSISCFTVADDTLVATDLSLGVPDIIGKDAGGYQLLGPQSC